MRSEDFTMQAMKILMSMLKADILKTFGTLSWDFIPPKIGFKKLPFIYSIFFIKPVNNSWGQNLPNNNYVNLEKDKINSQHPALLIQRTADLMCPKKLNFPSDGLIQSRIMEYAEDERFISYKIEKRGCSLIMSYFYRPIISDTMMIH
jgi:hypothetical protein